MGTLTAADICDRFATKYVRQVARHLVLDRIFPKDDLEDVVQELMLALLESRDAYDPTKARWTYFVKTIVDRKAVSLRRARSAESRGNTMIVASLNVLVHDEEGQRVELAQQVQQSEGGARRGIEHQDRQASVEQSINVSIVLAGLEPELANICSLLAQMSVAEAARELDIPRTTLISRLAKVRERFAEAGLSPSV
jgi:RNA polymerase sigma factor (sigma-70 family)